MAITASFISGASLPSVFGDQLDNTITTIRPFLGRTVMKKMPFGAVFAAALVAAGIPYAAAAPPTKTTLPVDFILNDPCSGEDVEFTGSSTVSLAFSANANTSHASLQISSHLDGVGLSTGARYKSNFEAKTEKNGSFAGFPFETNEALNLDFIGQGTVANETIKETMHITIDGNGTMTVNRSSLELTCRG
jgi:hypothetical protein